MSDASLNGRWWPLLALPVLCCVGHVVLLAVGVGSVTALVGGAVGSAVVGATGIVLTAVAVAVLLRRRERRVATSSADPDLTGSTRDGGPR